MNKDQYRAVYPCYRQGQQEPQGKVNASAASTTASTNTAEKISTLLRHPGLWQGSHCPRPTTAGLPTGYTALDEALHQGGWPLAGCTELLASTGSGELQLLAPALQQLATQGRIALLNPPYTVCAAGFEYLGIPAQQLLVVHSRNSKDGLWACEQLLTSGCFPAVLGWLEPQIACIQGHTRSQIGSQISSQISYANLRKLQICAQSRQSCLLLFRPKAVGAQASPASLRIALETHNTQLQVQILKQTGGWGGQQLLLARPDNLVAATPAAQQLPVPTYNGRHQLQAKHTSALELLSTTTELQPERPAEATPSGATRLQ